MRNVEILAPAGSFDSLRGAINGGCDAVYLGGCKFGARAFAENFDEETMLRAIDYVHLFDKKIYLTVNTLLHNEEIEEELFRYLEKYYRQGLDAVIVQDVGVLEFIHRNFPMLPIHASTQMTFTTEKGGELYKDHGVTRFVTSRELSIKEIQNIRKKTDLEIETFVHGALCYCYSGQCFLSSMIGGRSGNRGRCAQPCRMKYEVRDQDGRKLHTEPYVLSPKDMCTLDCIPDLVDAGIDSFKIEGRMKKPEYAAYTAYLYRKYTNLYLEYGQRYSLYLKKHKREVEEDYTCLMDLYNRGGFSKGYFYEKNGPKIMSMSRPNHSGVCVGIVDSIKKNRAVIQLKSSIYAQDVLEFRHRDGHALYEYTVKNNVDVKEKYTETNTKPGSKIVPGTKVYRTRRNELLNRIQTGILEQPKKREICFYFKGALHKPMELMCTAGEHCVTVYGEVLEASKSQPVTRERIMTQLAKINNTPYVLENCEVQLSGDLFIAMGQLNELRRNALEKIEQEICGSYKRISVVEQKMLSECASENNNSQTGVVVNVGNTEQFMEANRSDWVDCIYADMSAFSDEALYNLACSSKKAIYLVLPSILRGEDCEKFEQAFRNVYENKIAKSSLEKLFMEKQVEGFVLKNHEEVSLYLSYVKSNSNKKARLDYNMYTFNREAKEFWKTFGIEHSTAAIEMNGSEWRRNGCKDQDIIVYGSLVVMTSAQCVCKNTKKCTKTSETMTLMDRYDKEYHSINRCKYCYNQLYEKKPISLHEYMEEILCLSPEHIRLDFVQESAEEMRKILSLFQNAMEGKGTRWPDFEYTTGHYRKGVK